MWRDCVAQLYTHSYAIVMWDMTHSYVGHDSFVCDVLMFLIHIILYSFILYSFMLYPFILYSFTLTSFILYSFILYYIIFIHIVFIQIIFIHTATHHVLVYYLVICNLTHTYVTWLCCCTWHDNSAHSCANIALPVTHHVHVCQLFTCDTTSIIHTSCHCVMSPIFNVTRLCYTLIYSQICVTHSYIHWYIHWNIHSHIQSYIHWYHSYVMWLCYVPHIYTSWDCITHSYIHAYMLHAHMFTDVFTDVLWCPPGHSIPARLPPTHVQHDSFIRVIWRSHMRNTTHPYAL